MRRPTLDLAVALNRAVRLDDEGFDEPDALDRVERALRTIEQVDDPVMAAAILACRLTSTQGFGEGNKRTALLLARWILAPRKHKSPDPGGSAPPAIRA